MKKLQGGVATRLKHTRLRFDPNFASLGKGEYGHIPYSVVVGLGEPDGFPQVCTYDQNKLAHTVLDPVYEYMT